MVHVAPKKQLYSLEEPSPSGYSEYLIVVILYNMKRLENRMEAECVDFFPFSFDLKRTCYVAKLAFRLQLGRLAKGA